MSGITFKEIVGWKPLGELPHNRRVRLEVSESITPDNYKAVVAAAEAFMASKGKKVLDAAPAMLQPANILEVSYKEMSTKKR